MRTNTILRAAVAAVLIATPALRADEQAAKNYVNEAAQAFDSNDIDTAKSKLDLADAELDGVTGGGRQPIVDRIAELRAKLAKSGASADHDKYKRQLDRVMSDAEEAIGNLATWPGAESAAKELFESADAKAALGDELTAAQKKYATFKKLSDKKMLPKLQEQADNAVKDLESKWGEAKPKLSDPNNTEKDSIATDIDHEIESARRTVEQFGPPGDDKKPYATRIDTVAAEYTKIALADKVKDKAKQLQDAWDSYKDDWSGWEAEGEPLTLAKYTGEQNDMVNALNCPKSKALISRANQWLDNRKDDQDYAKLQAAPEVKVIYDKIVADRATAWAKIQKNAEAILAEAEAKKPLDQNTIDAISRFTNQLANNLEGSDQLAALTARADKLAKGAADAAAAGDAEKAAFYKDATAKAAAAWPDLKSKFTTADGFDPNSPGDFKGKLILLTTDNLMGYHYKPGSFPFATELNGISIAAKFDPAVAAAVKEVESKMGRSLGDSDDDGKWEIIARVEGTTGKLVKKVDVEGKIKDDAGNEATVTGEKGETMVAPIITIVAAHCGPLAAAGQP